MLEESQEPLTARVESVHNRKIERASEGKIRQFHNKRPAAQRCRRNPDKPFAILCWVFGLFAALTIAPTLMFAEERDDGGGHVLPGPAKPRGYSLSDMAKVTAGFNTPNPITGMRTFPYPDTPFQILYVQQNNNLTFEVSPGTMFYVPILYSDDTQPAIGDFPNVHDRKAVLSYFYSQKEIGNTYVKIKVDGTETSLGPDYVVGVGPVKLGDAYDDPATGAHVPAGTQYIVSAAFLTPLNKGTHTVEIKGSSDGAALFPFFPPNGVWVFSIKFTVIVRDED